MLPCSLPSTVIAINVSLLKGVRKRSVPSAVLAAGYGIEGDAHAGPGMRQVSLLDQESIEKMHAKGCDVASGDFAENITTSGLTLTSLELGDCLQIGDSALLEITQIGKECHNRCSIFYQAGDCVMPREGVFARVLRSGKISAGDEIKKVTKGN